MKRSILVAAGAVGFLLLGCSDQLTESGRLSPSAPRFDVVTGAVFTSTNPAVDDPNTASSSKHDLCLNASDVSPANDCNIYTEKQYVWLTGGPGPSGLADGTYMFAVLVPGGQGGNDAPNDCTENNLSDLCVTTSTGAGDTWENRVFSVTNGAISYLGTHDFQFGMIRLMGYDNTTNPGGEYVMAVCNLAGRDVAAENEPGVTPADCKYDNFKVKASCTEGDCGGGGDAQAASVVTEVHLANHTVIDGTNVAYLPAFGTITVHDKATVTTLGDPAADVPAGSTVDFYFYQNGTCSDTPFAGPDSKNISGASPASVDGGLPQTISAIGSYSYRAFFYSGDLTAVTDAEGECEPFTVAARLGKTMGFWGNTNGVAYINSHGGYAGNAVGIGRGSNIDTQGEAQKVFPNTLNACGKGNPFIYTVGGQTNGANCTLATGLNIGSFNTNAGQLLALNYNKIFVTGFNAGTIGTLGCTLYVTESLTSTSTIADVITAATGLVNVSAAGGAATQARFGAMNQLLGCLNREA